MALRGQQNLGLMPEVAASFPHSSEGHAQIMASSQTHVERRHSVRPLQQQLVDSLLRDGVNTHESSARFPHQSIGQSFQQLSGGMCSADPSGFYQYEDFAGILGERLASGSLSDVSISASDKVCSGHSSLGEQHGPRVKFMFSFGGKIVPRPGDGTLRYVGGDTRIISVHRHIKYSDLMQKMARLYGQPVLLKYQLPSEDLDALISISCEEDVENMMDEFDRLLTMEGSNRLRIFLFSRADCEALHVMDPVNIRNAEQIYMDAINGMGDIQAKNVLSLTDSINLTGHQAVDSLTTPQSPCSLSYVIPAVSSPQLAQSLAQPVVLQSSKQAVFPASTSTPQSPIAASQFAKQPEFPDVVHLQNETMLKVPVSNYYELQGFDVVPQDLKGVTIGNSKNSSSYQQYKVIRLTDSPPKPQHGGLANRLNCQQEQMLLSDSGLLKSGLTAGASIVGQVDAYGRVPRVGSSRNVSVLQQQQPKITASTVQENLLDCHLFDQVLPSLDTQSPLIQLNHSTQSVKHCNPDGREQDFQRVGLVQVAVPDNSLHSKQGLLANANQEEVTYNHQIQSNGMLNAIPSQMPLKVKTTLFASSSPLHLEAVQGSPLTVYPGSTPSSPSLKFKEMDINSYGIQPVLVDSGCPEQPLTPLLGQSQIEPVLRGLKPLNIPTNSQEKFALGGDKQFGNQQLPLPLSNLQKIEGGFNQQDWDCANSFFSEGLLEPKTLPQQGGFCCREHLTPFSEHRLSRKDEHGQEHKCCDGIFTAYSSNIEGIDWTMKRPEVEKPRTRLSGVGQMDLRTDTGMGSLDCNISGNISTSSKLEASITNPLSFGLTAGDVFKQACAPSTIGVTPQILIKERDLRSPELLSVNCEAPYPNPSLLTAGPENFVARAASTPASSLPPKTSNSNALSVSNVDHSRWNTGNIVNNEILEESLRPEKSSNNSLYFAGKLGMQTHDNNIQLQAGQNGHLNGQSNSSLNAVAKMGRSKSNEALGSSFQFPLAQSNHIHTDATNTPVSSLLPPISANNSVFNSSSYSLDGERLIHAGHLTDLTNEYEGENLASSIKMEGQECSPSGLANLQSAILISPQNVKAEVNLPIFDSCFVEDNEIRHPRGKVSTNVEAALLPPTLYSAPTLSMQNWEHNLSSVELKEHETGATSSTDIPDVSESLVSQKEVTIETSFNDSKGTDAHINPASLTEADAVSHGLQTIKNADLEELRELGTGTFGTVYHGKWRGTDVAIKRIKSSCFSGRPSERDRLIADFWKEAYTLGQLHHPNVVAFYGVVPDSPGGTLATVTEYMVNGSLKQVLQRKDRTIDRRKRLLIIMDAAFGMEYLHGRNIVHFDLKCENLLVNMKDPQRPICKVGDLGLSKVKHQTMVSGGVRGTLPWMAPELLNGSSSLVSEKVDVFSFGIVMWELLTGEEPYANMHYGAIIGGIVNNTLRPPVPSWCDPAWKSLMEKCWTADPGGRPTFPEIAAELRAMANPRTPCQTPVVA